VTALTRPRGPLPSRVYWTRRLLLLIVALGLVFGISRLLQTGGPGEPGGVSASPVGGSPTSTTTSTTRSTASPSPSATTEKQRQKKKHQQKQKKKALPEPDGPCDDSDVVVTPRIRKAHVGDPVRVVLEVGTQESAACTWEVSPESVFVTIAEEATLLWSSQHCPAVLPTEAVVPRREKADKVVLTWDGRESDAECSAATDYVLPGTYRIAAVARGAADPQDVLFVLGGPTRETVTRTPTPTPTPRDDRAADDRGAGPGQT